MEKTLYLILLKVNTNNKKLRSNSLKLFLNYFWNNYLHELLQRTLEGIRFAYEMWQFVDKINIIKVGEIDFNFTSEEKVGKSRNVSSDKYKM